MLLHGAAGGWDSRYPLAGYTREVKVSDMPAALEMLNGALRSTLLPAAASAFGLDASHLRVNEALIVQYDAASGHNALPIHRDFSLLTMSSALDAGGYRLGCCSDSCDAVGTLHFGSARTALDVCSCLQEHRPLAERFVRGRRHLVRALWRDACLRAGWRAAACGRATALRRARHARRAPPPRPLPACRPPPAPRRPSAGHRRRRRHQAAVLQPAAPPPRRPRTQQRGASARHRGEPARRGEPQPAGPQFRVRGPPRGRAALLRGCRRAQPREGLCGPRLARGGAGGAAAARRRAHLAAGCARALAAAGAVCGRRAAGGAAAGGAGAARARAVRGGGATLRRAHRRGAGRHGGRRGVGLARRLHGGAPPARGGAVVPETGAADPSGEWVGAVARRLSVEKRQNVHVTRVILIARLTRPRS
mmetsp:Transcript_20570/g.65784  ORF Transcript_20570/g.65784 Transcript_20570/m.65784 type:complete len:420 (+) Transcript_20570:2-1261(+)